VYELDLSFSIGRDEAPTDQLVAFEHFGSIFETHLIFLVEADEYFRSRSSTQATSVT